MKKLILAAMILSTNIFAHGWFEFKLARFMEQGKLGPVMAVGMREPLGFGVNYLNWNGLGVNYKENIWFTSNHELEFEFDGGVSVIGGVSLRDNDVNYSDLHIGIRLPLWY